MNDLNGLETVHANLSKLNFWVFRWFGKNYVLKLVSLLERGWKFT